MSRYCKGGKIKQGGYFGGVLLRIFPFSIFGKSLLVHGIFSDLPFSPVPVLGGWGGSDFRLSLGDDFWFESGLWRGKMVRSAVCDNFPSKKAKMLRDR